MIEDIETVIERLEKAISICIAAEKSPGYSDYAYAAGYSRAIMVDTINELKNIMYNQSQ
jgi:hypothetical protein